MRLLLTIMMITSLSVGCLLTSDFDGIAGGKRAPDDGEEIEDAGDGGE